MPNVLIYLHSVFMPCPWYANHTLRVNIIDSISVCLLILAGRIWRKQGRNKTEGDAKKK